MQLLMTVVKKLKYGENIKMKISEEGKQLIKKFEGCELEAYKCSAGVWTIGYGRTKNVSKGDVCSQEQADIWLAEELPVFGAYVSDAVTVPLVAKTLSNFIELEPKSASSCICGPKRLLVKAYLPVPPQETPI